MGVIGMIIQLKRVYNTAEPTDGKRILVDRLWPRGLKKQEANIDEWIREIAPSDGLRKWFGHDSTKWNEFRLRYMEELRDFGKRSLLEKLVQECSKGKVTLLYAAKDEQNNNTFALRVY
jgi:uncharacterized protein YeaO (DUF488 family)